MQSLLLISAFAVFPAPGRLRPVPAVTVHLVDATEGWRVAGKPPMWSFGLREPGHPGGPERREG